VKISIRYTLTGAEPVTVVCGPRAISAAEKNFTVKVASDGLSLEHLGFVAWAQSGFDGRDPGDWPSWWKRIDDLDVVPAADPTGAGTEASPASSSGSPSEPASRTSS
jgi:hypothetical protein